LAKIREIRQHYGYYYSKQGGYKRQLDIPGGYSSSIPEDSPLPCESWGMKGSPKSMAPREMVGAGSRDGNEEAVAAGSSRGKAMEGANKEAIATTSG
jgi:hypothetical protein